jgi:acetoin utilization deacetylase AcuC-like enzyme
MAIGAVYSPRYLEHNDPSHPENAGRLQAIVTLLQRSGAWSKARHIAPQPISMERLTSLHTAAYVEQVRQAAEAGRTWLDLDTYLSPASYQVALLAAGGVIQGVEAVLSGQVTAALALVRPPGHHARPMREMGFCLFNNVALGALHALEERGLERVLIVDWDVHHGNGTQEAFYHDGRVMYLSTHQFPYYPGTGAVQETGAGAGVGCMVNVPLPPGVGDAGYRRVFEEVVLPAGRRFRPQLVLVSAGYDPHWADPLAAMRVSVRGFAHMAATVRQIAQECCPGRLVLALEGGYDPQALAYGVLATWRTWEGCEPGDVEDPLGPAPDERPADDRHVEQVLAAVKAVHGI